MQTRELAVTKWKQVMLPLVFTFSSLLNFLFYYLGLAFQENAAREYGFIIGCALFAVLTGLSVLYALWKERFAWHQWLLWASVLLFFFAAFAHGLLRHGLHYLFFDYLQKFILFCLPAFFVGICAAKWRTEQNFIVVLEKLSFFAFPAALAYFMQVMFNTNPFNWGRDLGIIGYMPFAYTLMPLLMALVIRFSDKEVMTVPFINRTIAHPQIIRLFMILVFWIAIYSSGTRGAMICMICFLVLLLLFKVIRREKIKATFLVSGVMVAVLVFNLFVYAPAGMKWLGRMDMFLQGLLSGEIITSPEDDKIGNSIDDYVALNPTSPSVTTPTVTDPAEPTSPTTPPGTTPPPTEPSNPIDLNNHGITSRGTLFKIAFKEFLKNPLFGMGPGGYSVKYNMFPHNVILELLAETGIVGTAFVITVVLFALIKLIKPALKDKNVLYVLLFFITYAVQANCNGTIWYCSALLCALGYGITFRATNPPTLAEHSDTTGESK